MSGHWFHLPVVPPVGAAVRLEGDEARHAQARRLRDGEMVTLFDGAGTIAEAAVDGRAPRLRVTSVRTLPPPAWRIEVGAALPRGDRAATLLDMTTQLGMSAFTPIESVRGRSRRPAALSEQARRRSERVLLEACKQSRRAFMPLLRDESDAETFVTRIRDEGGMVLVGHQDGDSPARVLAEARSSKGAGFIGIMGILVGPEGGFDDTERAAIDAAGATRVAIGRGILRVETAAVALLSVVVGDLGE